ncbi:hypothetical protein D9M68_431750 [compost metagenome]
MAWQVQQSRSQYTGTQHQEGAGQKRHAAQEQEGGQGHKTDRDAHGMPLWECREKRCDLVDDVRGRCANTGDGGQLSYDDGDRQAQSEAAEHRA